ncbi:DUF4349 domain-containing protein [Chryseolinea soli]|uniref:DUF4349 domain-containing protein n=2 Tax=Chryseolinea soli TaxID=2321403 RepID=A0A385SJE8_9BACT|nr:DUF4349 domain-containing protein [Chryseolinea soli]
MGCKKIYPMKNMLLCATLLLCLASCGTHTSYSARYLSDLRSAPTAEAAADKNRVVLYNASITLLLKEPDSLNKKLPLLTKKYDGYVMTVGDELSTIRVPAAQLSNVLQDLSAMGKVTARSLSGQDVTDDYTDYTIRLDNAEKARQRYLQLLEKAENVEAAVKVEKELERLNSEIDLLKGKLARFDHLAAFSTVTIHLRKKHKIGLLGYPFVGLYKGIKWLFVRD